MKFYCRNHKADYNPFDCSQACNVAELAEGDDPLYDLHMYLTDWWAEG